MHNDEKLSLLSAIIININIMLGSGIFININELAKYAGPFGALSYVLIGILLLPLILSIVELLHLHPVGGFYTFASHEIHPFAGFVSAWSYFVGKLASGTLTIHIAVLLLQQLFPNVLVGSPFYYDAFILILFIGLNMLHIHTGKNIQFFFLGMKLIPVFFIIILSFFFFSTQAYSISLVDFKGIPSTLPLVLFATLGFEAACSLSSQIKNSRDNAPKAVLISYFIVISILMLYQALCYGLLGKALATLPSFKQAYPLLLSSYGIYESLRPLLLTVLNAGIIASVLGGSYGILFSNMWNLFILAEHDHTFAKKSMTQLNRYDIPFLCVLAEGTICALYFIITKANQVPLQQTAALGCTVGYLLSVLSLFMHQKKLSRGGTDIFKQMSLSVTGLLSCALLLAVCFYNLLIYGIASLSLYLFLIIFGILMFCLTYFQRNKSKYAQD